MVWLLDRLTLTGSSGMMTEVHKVRRRTLRQTTGFSKELRLRQRISYSRYTYRLTPAFVLLQLASTILQIRTIDLPAGPVTHAGDQSLNKRLSYICVLEWHVIPP